MNVALELADAPTRSDLTMFLERVLRAGAPEVRVVARDRAFAVYGCTQMPEGLLDQLPVVLVMRAFALAQPAQAPVDVTVTARGLLDRLARLEGKDTVLVLPDNTVGAAWAGVLPPFSGWETAGTLDATSLRKVAREGIERVSQLLPDQPGEAVVRTVRRQVWGSEIAAGVPASIAFAAESLGFLNDETRVQLSRSVAWLRASSARGHVLVRQGLGGVL